MRRRRRGRAIGKKLSRVTNVAREFDAAPCATRSRTRVGARGTFRVAVGPRLPREIGLDLIKALFPELASGAELGCMY